MDRTSRIFVAGHRGMVGSAVVRMLQEAGFDRLVLRTRQELDLTRQAEVEAFFRAERPTHVFLAAARVGGIMANQTYRGEFIFENLAVQTNVINAAHEARVKKLLFFSSSCVYPRLCPQPMKEEDLWSGPREPTNEPYAVAKLAGMTMGRAYRDQFGDRFFSVIPTNLYGPNDNYDEHDSHFVPALIRKFHRAKVEGAKAVTLWGTGEPRREIMYVDDLARIAVALMRTYEEPEPVNIGTGRDHTIREIASLVGDVVGYSGEVVFDRTKPDGMPRKLLDCSRLHQLGQWTLTGLAEGLRKSYADYLRTEGGAESHLTVARSAAGRAARGP